MPETDLLYPLLAVSRLRMETDGEGLTTLVAGAGCPLSCRYCLNAQVLRKKPEFVTPMQLFERTRIDNLYFQATGGGLTFGGGESLLHVPFIRSVRALCGDCWHLYAETSLAVDRQTILEAAEVFDDFIVDIKTADPRIYEAYTGSDCRNLVFSNLRLLLERKGSAHIRVRVPLIPAYNTPEDQRKTRMLLEEMGITRIELFDYVIRS